MHIKTHFTWYLLSMGLCLYLIKRIGIRLIGIDCLNIYVSIIIQILSMVSFIVAILLRILYIQQQECIHKTTYACFIDLYFHL